MTDTELVDKIQEVALDGYSFSFSSLHLSRMDTRELEFLLKSLSNYLFTKKALITISGSRESALQAIEDAEKDYKNKPYVELLTVGREGEVQ